MRVLGELGLLATLVASACGMLLGVGSNWSVLRPFRRVGTWAALSTLPLLTLTMVALAVALVTKDFRFDYVSHYTNRDLPWHYSLSALWVGQAGSLLLWTWLTCLLSGWFHFQISATHPLRDTALGVLMANVLFLTLVMVFAADPMKASIAERADGLGLSPLLQHPSMLIHPPVVFLAYAAWAVPFALALAALLTGHLDKSWLELARPWALGAWTVLGAGLLLGANWAYQELGWGGYWGWDPVENGSLLPWLTGTGLIHGLMTWKFRGGLKKTTLSLAILTFGLCNFATFLTRSGIFSSVHAFSQSPIGWMFLALMVVLLAVGAVTIWIRRGELAATQPITGLATREALVVATNFLLLVFTAVVLVGTLCLPLSQMLTGRMAQIGPAFYGNVLAPIALLILAAIGAAPLLRWGGAPARGERRLLLYCGAAAVAFAGLDFAMGEHHPLILMVLGLASWIVLTTGGRVWLDTTRHPQRSWRARGVWLWRQRRFYAGLTVHLGLAAVAIGVCGSTLGTQRVEWDLNEGETREWAGRTIEYRRLVQREERDKLVAEVELWIAQAGSTPTAIRPARHYHTLQEEWTTEVAIHSTWKGDLYVILHAGLGEGRVALTLIDNPKMRWLWSGGGLIGVASLVALWPARRRRRRDAGTLRPLAEGARHGQDMRRAA